MTQNRRVSIRFSCINEVLRRLAASAAMPSFYDTRLRVFGGRCEWAPDAFQMDYDLDFLERHLKRRRNVPFGDAKLAKPQNLCPAGCGRQNCSGDALGLAETIEWGLVILQP